MLGKEIYPLCAGGGEVAMESEFSLGNRPQRYSQMTRPIPRQHHRPPAPLATLQERLIIRNVCCRRTTI
jgi:hypothetical protein